MSLRSRRAVTPILLLSVLLAGLPPALRAQTIANPDLFEKSAEAARGALEHFGEYDNPAQLRRVADIGYQLAMQSGYRDVPFSFYLVDMRVPNAFALPGGHIFVTRGMLDLGLDDDMLACLLGHEIAHVTQRHGIRMQRKAALLQMLSTAAMLGVLLGVKDDNTPARDGTYQPGDSRKGNLATGAMATGIVVSELLLRNNSREFEDEADDEGQRLAAAGGYDPNGARELWDLMGQRLPQAKEFGYWRTHPFSDVRLRAANARARELKIQKPKPDEDYRALTQKALLDFADTFAKKREKREERRAERRAENAADQPAKKIDRRRFVELGALTAWPEGRTAEGLRRTHLHRQRETVREEKNEVARDYGALVRAYLAEIEEVRVLSPDSDFLGTLERELADLRAESTELYPKAQAVWQGGVYETPFLEIFLSNFPTVKEAPDVALKLGDAYSRLKRQTDAVTQYLRAVEAGPEHPAAQRALAGLRNLAPYLDRLAALQRIGNQVEDEALRTAADKRLAAIVDTYEDLENGAEYLDCCGDGDFAAVVQERQDTLAQNLYGEVLLYQAVGDNVKALDRIQKILTHAPLSPAAEQLRDKAVTDT